MRCYAHCDALRVRAAVGNWGPAIPRAELLDDQGETAEDRQAGQGVLDGGRWCWSGLTGRQADGRRAGRMDDMDRQAGNLAGQAAGSWIV